MENAYRYNSKLAKLSGVLNILKRYLPEYVLRTLYCNMVQSRLTYGILAWGFYHYRLEKIQNRIIRIISRSKYNAPTRPIFKDFELLTINDLFSLNCLRFLYNYKNKNLPTYFCELTYTPRSDILDYDTRYADLFDIESTRTVMAEKCIRVHLGNVMNNTLNIIMDKINTHSIYGFVFSIKIYYLDSYWDKLFIEICPPHKVEYMNIYQIVKSWVLVDFVPHFLSSSLSSPSPHQYDSIKLETCPIFFFSFSPVIRQWPSRTHVLFCYFFVCSIDQIVRIFHGNMIRVSAWLWYRSSKLRWGWAISISASCHHLCLGGLTSAIGPWTGWCCLWGGMFFFVDKWNLLYYQCVYNYVNEIKGRS